MNRDTPTPTAERTAWKGYSEAVQQDLRRPGGGGFGMCPPASLATLAAGAAWFKAYRERELREGRAK